VISPSYISASVLLLAQLLPLLGVQIGTEELTAFVSTVVSIIAGIVILVRRYQKGDLNVAGFKKLG
jgi:uncharacterized membrane protein